MKKKKIIAVLIIFLFSSLIMPTSALGNTNLSTSNSSIEYNRDWHLDLQVNRLMKLSYINSLSVAIVKNNSIIWSKGYGYSNISIQKKTTKDTIFRVASISKAITGTAMMQLIENDTYNVNLDDDVNKHINFSLRNPNYPDIPITIRMLLAHQSSIHDHDLDQSYEYLFGDYPRWFLKEILVEGGSAYNESFWYEYPPGNGAKYSNLGFTVVGYIIEQISGQTFEDYCKKNIFIPLDMKNTSFKMGSLNFSNFSLPYITYLGQPIEQDCEDFTFGEPCGSLLSTAEDLSHFLIAHMNKGVYKKNRILNESNIELMHQIQYPESEPYAYFLRFGLGWLHYQPEIFDIKLPVANYMGHNGDLDQYHARMKIKTSNNDAVIFCYSYSFKAIVLSRVRILLYNLCPIRLNNLFFNKAQRLN